MMPQAAPRKGVLSAVAYAGMFVFGIVMALLGAVMPSLSQRLAFTLSEAGTLFLVMNFCMLVTSLVLGVTMDRFGMKPPLAAGPWLVVTALYFIITAARFEDLLPAVICLGIGGGALNGATNTLVADLHDEARNKGAALNLLGVFFGIGALFLPLLFGMLLTTFGFAGLLAAAAVLCGATGVFASMLRFPPPKQARGLPFAQMPRFLRLPVVLAMAFLLFFQSGNEFLLGGYFATFLTRDLSVEIGAASYFLAGYWAAIIVTRIFLSRALLRLDGHRVILICAVVASIGSGIVAAATTPAIAAAGIILTGTALSGIFPTLLGIAGAQFADHSGTIFGILFTVALTGGMTMPWLSGRIADNAGLRWVFLLAAANFAAIAILNLVAASMRKRAVGAAR